jgi:hypothetical protein
MFALTDVLAVRRDDGPSGGDLRPYVLDAHALSHRDELHLLGELAGAGRGQLGGAVGSAHEPGRPTVGQPGCVGGHLRSSGVVLADRLPGGQRDLPERHPQLAELHAPRPAPIVLAELGLLVLGHPDSCFERSP